MIDRKLAQHILTIGPDFTPPKGGIAQVLCNYQYYVFAEGSFLFIANSCAGYKIKKILNLLSSLIYTFFKLLFNPKIKIVHIHTASNFSFQRSVWFMKLALFFKRKTIMHIHGGGFKNYYEKSSSKKNFVRSNLKLCSSVIALSPQWKKTFEEDLDLNNVQVLDNIVPKAQRKNIATDDKLHILFLGLLSKEKGIFDLIEVMRLNHDKWQGKIMLHVAGNGESQLFKQYIKELDDIITFEGWVSGTNKIRLLNLCQIFVLPSYKEGLPISILESMAYGMPIIATPVGAIPSVVKNGDNGFLVPIGNLESLSVAINTLIDNHLLISKMGLKSLKKVQRFMPENVSARLTDIYLRLI